jgi:hypothetical protein
VLIETTEETEMKLYGGMDLHSTNVVTQPPRVRIVVASNFHSF